MFQCKAITLSGRFLFEIARVEDPIFTTEVTWSTVAPSTRAELLSPGPN
jgi:hypothetical protein